MSPQPPGEIEIVDSVDTLVKPTDRIEIVAAAPVHAATETVEIRRQPRQRHRHIDRQCMPFGTLDCSATHKAPCCKQSLDLGKRNRRHHPIGIDGHQDLTAGRFGAGIACHREVGSADLDDRRTCRGCEARVRSVAVEDNDSDLRLGADRLPSTCDGAQAPSQICLRIESRHHNGEPRHVPVIG